MLKMIRFIVIGTYFGGSAHLHVVAKDRDAAEVEYHHIFGDRVRGWDVTVVNLDESLYMVKHWKGHGHSSYHAGY